MLYVNRADVVEVHNPASPHAIEWRGSVAGREDACDGVGIDGEGRELHALLSVDEVELGVVAVCFEICHIVEPYYLDAVAGVDVELGCHPLRVLSKRCVRENSGRMRGQVLCRK